MSSRVRLVLLDLDNTLYDWVAFFVPSMLAMVKTLAAALNVQPDGLVPEFRSVYTEHDSVEYSFAVQRLPCVARLPISERRIIVDRCRLAFLDARAERLVAYPGVLDTLATIRADGIDVVAITNAPMHQAMRRLELLGMDSMFSAVAARRSFPVPEDPCVPSAIAVRKRSSYSAEDRFWQFDPKDLKPSDRMYRHALRAMQIEPAHTLVVGDNLAKDIAPGVRLGARGAWARYGLDFDRGLWGELLSFTPWTAAHLEAHHAMPIVAVTPLERFADILDWL